LPKGLPRRDGNVKSKVSNFLRKGRRERAKIRPNDVGSRVPGRVPIISEKLVFNRLPYTIQREICELMITREVVRLRNLGYDIDIASETVELLVREGFHRTLGARPMRNTVDRFLQEAATKTQLSQDDRIPCRYLIDCGHKQ